MPINGLLINLSDDVSLAEETLKVMDSHDQLELGEKIDRWIPVVVESEDTRNSHAIHEWINSLQGVISADVIFASVDQPNPIPTGIL